MKLEKLNISETLNDARKLLEQEKHISPALKAIIELLFTIISLFAGRLSKTSRNSSKPPSTDPNRDKKNKNKDTKNKPGGQLGRKGVNLEPIAEPDKIVLLTLDKRLLPPGTYKDVGFETRQVIELEISRIVIEYQAQILENEKGKRYTRCSLNLGVSISFHLLYHVPHEKFRTNRSRNTRTSCSP